MIQWTPTKIALATTSAAAATGVAALFIYSQRERHRTEERAYTTLPVGRSSRSDFELRRYEPRVVARTWVEGNAQDASDVGFRRLARYIFGDNTSARRLADRTPTHESRLALRDQDDGKRIAMTTPVERSPEPSREDAHTHGWTIAFTMPRHARVDDLPRPLDARVELEEEPALDVAVRRFAGRATEADRARLGDQLLAAIRADGLEAIGDPTLAQYDPPWVLAPWRRNEVWVPVRPSI